MAVQTRGVQLDVMPHYTPSDPNLVALDPNRAVKGFVTAQEIAESLARLKAFRAQQAELDATRQSRIDAAMAGNVLGAARSTAAMPNVDVQGRLAGAQAQSELDKLAPATKADIAASDLNAATSNAAMANVLPSASLQGSKIAAELSKLNPQTEADIAAAKARAGNANIDIVTQPARQSLAQLQTQGAVTRAPQEEAIKGDLLDLESLQNNYRLTTDPLKFQTIVNQLNDQIKNASTDADKKRALENAEIQFKNAQTEEAKAHAKFYDEGGKAADPISQLGRLHTMATQTSSEIDRLLKSEVPNPDGSGTKLTLSQYLSLTRDSNGEIGSERNGFLWMNKALKPTNSEAEAQIARIEDLRKQLVGQYDMAHKFASGNVAVPAPLSPQAAPKGPQSTGASTNGPVSQGPGLNPNSTTSFSTLKEAEEAYAQGRLQIGTRVTIAGKSGIWK